MDFTGERYIPSEEGKIRIEHYHRYALVRDAIKDKNVLDLACGEGYGSFLLSANAKSVLGVDISDETVAHARKKYKNPNLAYKQGAAAKLDLDSDSFDVVVSFETIEHLAEQREMVSEIHRVLKPNGVFIVSSPNRIVYSEESGEHNDYHVKELDFSELDELLSSFFSNINYYGQRLLMGSVVQPLEKSLKQAKIFNDNGQDIEHRSATLKDPVYYLAVCSAKKQKLPTLDMSILYPEKLDLVKEYVAFAKWAQNLDVEMSEKIKHLGIVQTDLKEREQQLAHYKANAEANELEIQKIRTVMAGHEAQLAEKTKHVALVQSDLKQREEQLAHFSSSAKENEAELGRVRTIMAKHDALFMEKVEHLKQLQLDLDDRETNLTLYKANAEENEMELGKVRALMAEQQSQFTGKLKQLEFIQKDLGEREKQLAHYKANAEENELELGKVRALMAEQQSQLSEKVKHLERAQLIFQRQLTTNLELKSSLQAAEDEVLHLKNIQHDAQSFIDVLETGVAQWEREQKKHLASKEQASLEISSLKQQVSMKEAEVQTLNLENSTLSQEVIDRG